MVVRVPVERVMGPVQKIVYIHVPSAIATMIAFGVTFAAGIAFLTTRRWFWDALGAWADREGTSVAALIATVDRGRADGSLASALRVAILSDALDRAKR